MLAARKARSTKGRDPYGDARSETQVVASETVLPGETPPKRYAASRDTLSQMSPNFPCCAQGLPGCGQSLRQAIPGGHYSRSQSSAPAGRMYLRSATVVASSSSCVTAALVKAVNTLVKLLNRAKLSM